MKSFGSIFLAAALLPTIAPTQALAESLRCKNDFAEIGESKAAVLAKCGEPARKEPSCVQMYTSVAPQQGISGKQTAINVLPCVSVDEWTYNPGSGQFLTTLRFENGELKSITYGDRVP